MQRAGQPERLPHGDPTESGDQGRRESLAKQYDFEVGLDEQGLLDGRPGGRQRLGTFGQCPPEWAEADAPVGLVLRRLDEPQLVQ